MKIFTDLHVKSLHIKSLQTKSLHATSLHAMPYHERLYKQMSLQANVFAREVRCPFPANIFTSKVCCPFPTNIFTSEVCCPLPTNIFTSKVLTGEYLCSLPCLRTHTFTFSYIHNSAAVCRSYIDSRIRNTV